MFVAVRPAHADPSLPSDQVFFVGIDKAGARSAGRREGRHQAASTMLFPDRNRKAHWTGSGLLYAHSDPEILCL